MCLRLSEGLVSINWKFIQKKVMQVSTQARGNGGKHKGCENLTKNDDTQKCRKRY